MSQLDKEFLNLLNEKLVTSCKENKLEELKACWHSGLTSTWGPRMVSVMLAFNMVKLLIESPRVDMNNNGGSSLSRIVRWPKKSWNKQNYQFVTLQTDGMLRHSRDNLWALGGEYQRVGGEQEGSRRIVQFSAALLAIISAGLVKLTTLSR